MEAVSFQEAFNVLLSGFMLISGWFLKALYDSLRDLQSTDKTLAEKVNKIEVLVAGEYVKRHEFDTKVDMLFSKLDSIRSLLEEKIDGVKVKNGVQ